MKRKYKFIMFITLVFMCIVSFSIPTFSKFQLPVTNNEWDGTIANSFSGGTGTISDPYIISNPSEFAFFAYSLNSNNYEGQYIKLANDIIINEGAFTNNGGLHYIYNDNLYYLNVVTSKYYSDSLYENEVGSINIFPTLNGFRGTLDGGFHTIYGFYGTSSLFDNLSGTIENIYIDNSFIHGGHLSAGVVLNADGAVIRNIVFDGNIIASENANPQVVNINIPDFDVTTSYSIKLSKPSTTTVDKYLLHGICSGIDTFILNNQEYDCSNFIIELNTENVNIITESAASFSNLSYEMHYDENKTAGIVLTANNSEISGVVNNGTLKGINVSGLVGTLNSTTLTNSYNNGKIIAATSSGISDMVISNVAIINSYNNSSLTYGLINNIVDSTLNITNCFTTHSKPIGNVKDSNITITSGYSTYNYEDIYNTQFLPFNIDAINNLYPLYEKGNTSNGNVWVLNNLPMLYFDDAKAKTIQIKIDDYTWNTNITNVNNINYDSSFTVTLSATDVYKPIKEVYYYLAHDVLSNFDDIAWVQYNGSFSITEEGNYIVYIKYVDYNDNITYINSDRIIFDLTGASATITANDSTWSEYHNPVNIYNGDAISYTVVAQDLVSGVNKIEYIVSEEIKTIDDLNGIEEWNIYTDEFNISEVSKYIIYVKVTDNSNNVTYVNTDKIITLSYHVDDLKSGNALTFNKYMTSDSTFNLNISLNRNLLENRLLNRYIFTDKALGVGTLIILRDLSSKEVYEYTVSDSTYSTVYNGYIYGLENFKKIGKASDDEYFDNAFYDDKEQESFNISFDFKNTTGDIAFNFLGILEDDLLKINEDIKIELTDVEHNYLSIESLYNGTINDTNSVATIPLKINLNSFVLNDKTITDTTIENKFKGISISVVDDKLNSISKDKYQDLRFMHNGNIYVPNLNNETNINIANNQNISLDVVFNHLDLAKGTYYLKITGYLSIDGINKDYETEDYVLVPFVVSEQYKIPAHTFNVSINDSRIINKGSEVSFIVKQTGLSKPNIHVSLYKKKVLTAYNQEYVLVDLKEYVVNDLTTYEQGKYIMDGTTLMLKNDIESNGYKFVFELFDDDNKITETGIITIVR